jgi:hypothetical protein
MFGWLLKGKSKHQDRELIRESSDFIEGLPSVDLGKPLDREAPYLGKEKVFYQFYVNVIGESAASEILKQHGFERSALFGLHFAATKIATIPKVKLMDLADGDRELIGFGFQPPTKCDSWAIPFEHYKAELLLGRAITEPVKH